MIGFFVCGGNSGLMALFSITYPVAIRGTGIGWAYTIGKIGGMMGPLIIGFLLAQKLSVGYIFGVMGIVGLICAFLVWMLKRHLEAKAA